MYVCYCMYVCMYVREGEREGVCVYVCVCVGVGLWGRQVQLRLLEPKFQVQE
jgi:hypothetical protein